MTNVTKQTFSQEVLEQEGLTVVDFWASWCGPCMMLKPVLEELEPALPGVRFCKVNVDEEQALAMEYGIVSIPTLLLFKGGKQVAQLVGYRDMAQLQKELEERL